MTDSIEYLTRVFFAACEVNAAWLGGKDSRPGELTADLRHQLEKLREAIHSHARPTSVASTDRETKQ